MPYKKLHVSTLILLGLGISGLQAQENLNTTGGNASGSGGTVSYSVGQNFYTTNKGTNGTVTQGVQQPFEISVITELEGAKVINLKITAYPNPTTNYLTLSIDELETSNLSFQLFDMNGKLLQNQKITKKQTSIVMINLVPGTYIIKVLEKLTGVVNQKEVKTFRIIKN